MVARIFVKRDGNSFIVVEDRMGVYGNGNGNNDDGVADFTNWIDGIERQIFLERLVLFLFSIKFNWNQKTKE